MMHPPRLPLPARMVALLLAGTLAACHQSPREAAPPAPPPLATLAVQPIPVQREQTWDGVVEAVDATTIAAQTNARVEQLAVDVGDRVAKGDVLLRLTDVEQRSARRGAAAAVASAQAAYDEAQANWKRASELSQRGLIARAQLDQALARRDSTRAALDAAQAGLRSAGEQAGYTVVRAPFDGVVTRRFVQVGEAVQSGPPTPQPLIAMASLAALRVDVVVPQSAVAAIRQSQSAAVLPDAADAAPVRAGKVTVFPYADPVSHSFRVRVELPGGTSGLYPGMTVKVAFPVGSGDRLLVPESALIQRSEVSGVYVVGADHSVLLRQLRVGQRHGDEVEVLSGLAAGERIAIDPGAAALYLAELHARAGKAS
ncbi:MAG: efflux RND transporter periplasmic adaptor subunit [Proteobacteria bacterium]|nr:efflux RND transporter periplasmic adaptor subunit [Pseudomonadota bacterium]